jgi:hypothetical protein
VDDAEKHPTHYPTTCEARLATLSQAGQDSARVLLYTQVQGLRRAMEEMHLMSTMPGRGRRGHISDPEKLDQGRGMVLVEPVQMAREPQAECLSVLWNESSSSKRGDRLGPLLSRQSHVHWATPPSMILSRCAQRFLSPWDSIIMRYVLQYTKGSDVSRVGEVTRHQAFICIMARPRVCLFPEECSGPMLCTPHYQPRRRHGRRELLPHSMEQYQSSVDLSLIQTLTSVSDQ